MTPKLQNIYQTGTNEVAPLQLDFIGDVHGYANALENLLAKMNYTKSAWGWSHPNSKAVFVGDFINRGPHNKRTVEIIRKMVENGNAYAILGNHEINAICYFTKRKSGKPIRMPGPANRKQLDRIKREYLLQPNLFVDTIEWLRKLPLFIDFGNVRVVHAYWSDSHIETLKYALNEKKLKRKFLKEVMQGGTPVSRPFMQTTKGIEFAFPTNLIVRDNDKFRRINYRVKWWENPHGKSFESISLETKYTLPDIAIPDLLILPFEVYQPTSPPVFIGHYCMSGHNPIPVPNICCVDACVAGGGKLAAYRWNGEQTLSREKMIFADSFTEDDD